MAALVANRVRESTATTGTGTINLGGAETGYIAFSSAFSTADTVHYVIEDGNDWEYGIGTLTTGSPWTLARTTVLETLVSGTYDNTSPTAISLSGSAIVGVAPVAYPPGSIVQTVFTENSTNTSDSTGIPKDNTIPQNTEGTELMTATIVPKYTDSLIVVRVTVFLRGGSGASAGVALFKDSGADAIRATYVYNGSQIGLNPVYLMYKETSGSTTSRTFKVRFGQNTGTMYVNGELSGDYYGGTIASSIEIQEIRQ